jgi:hypothetical protein
LKKGGRKSGKREKREREKNREKVWQGLKKDIPLHSLRQKRR